MKAELLTKSIAAGVNFLHHRQRPSGHFILNSRRESDEETPPFLEVSTFLTACAAYCLSWVPGAEDIRQRALYALESEINGHGSCRYFASEQVLMLPSAGLTVPLNLVPDLDTSACVAFAFQQEGRKVGSRQVFLHNRTPAGLFETWLLAEPPDLDDMFPFVYMVPRHNDVCCGINANVLLFLGDCEDTSPASEYLQDIFCNQDPQERSAYYTDELVLAYMYSRAFFESAPSLGTARPAILKRLLAHQQQDGSFGSALRTAMAVCTLVNLNASGSAQDGGVQFLLDHQSAEGSWPLAPFYTWNNQKTPMQQFLYCAGTKRELHFPAAQGAPTVKHFASEEVTTLYCLEALARSRFGGVQ